MNRARNQKTETPTVNDKFFEDLLVALDNDPTGQAPTLRLNTKLKSPPSKLPSKYEQSENGDIGSRYNMSELDSPQVSCASESTASEDRKTRRARIRRDLEPSPSPIFSAALTLQEETDRNTNRNSKQQYSPTLSNQTSLGVLELANIKIGTLFSTAKLSDKLAGQDFNFMDDSQTQQLISQVNMIDYRHYWTLKNSWGTSWG